MRLGQHRDQWLRRSGCTSTSGTLDRRAEEADVEGAVDQAGDLAGGQQLAAEVQLELGSSVRSIRLRLGSSSYVADPVKPIVTLPIRPSRIS